MSKKDFLHKLLKSNTSFITDKKQKRLSKNSLKIKRFQLNLNDKSEIKPKEPEVKIEEPIDIKTLEIDTKKIIENRPVIKKEFITAPILLAESTETSKTTELISSSLNDLLTLDEPLEDVKDDIISESTLYETETEISNGVGGSLLNPYTMKTGLVKYKTNRKKIRFEYYNKKR